jgi:hypothetical protein
MLARRRMSRHGDGAGQVLRVRGCFAEGSRRSRSAIWRVTLRCETIKPGKGEQHDEPPHGLVGACGDVVALGLVAHVMSFRRPSITESE